MARHTPEPSRHRGRVTFPSHRFVAGPVRLAVDVPVTVVGFSQPSVPKDSATRGVLPVSNPVNDTTMCSPSSLIWTYPCWCTSTPVAAGQYPCEYVLSPLRDDAAAIGAPSAVGNPPHGLFDPSSADRVCASPCTMKTLPTAFSNRSVRAATCAGYSVHP